MVQECFKDVLEITCELVTKGLSIVVGNVQAQHLVFTNHKLHLYDHLHENNRAMVSCNALLCTRSHTL